MYVGNRSLEIDEIVTDEDIVIPIFLQSWYSNVKGKFLWNEYTWNGDVFPGMEDELEDIDEVNVASPGVGSAANSYMSLVNIEDYYIRIDNAGVSATSPGRGAFTIYHGRSFYATDPIDPGSEIFVSYGNSYFQSRKRVYGYLPLPPDDYDAADEILNEGLGLTAYNKRIGKKQEQHHHPSQSSPASLRQAMWHDLHSLLLDFSEIFKKSRILNAVPPNASIVEEVLIDGGTAWQDFNRSIKDLHWLEENGQCMDNIKPGVSTIPDAGRGAFASRFIPSGGLVAPAPLVHIKTREMIRTYLDVTTNKIGDSVPDREGRSSFQLLLNYCFGHEQSSLLLCPYGLLTSLINHSHDEPNTKLQWAKEMRHREWLEQPIQQWGDVYHTGLQFDFVATRDIAPGEEILIDYGEAWQREWDGHVKRFVPRTDPYVPAFELNEIGYDLDLRMEEDQDYELENIRLHCRWHYLRRHGVRKTKGAQDPACRIVRKLGEDSYLVRLVEWDDDQSHYKAGRLVWGIPKDGFFFRDLHLSRDHHQAWAFRHAMLIPDDLFPEIWKNYRDGGDDGVTEYIDEDDSDESEDD